MEVRYLYAPKENVSSLAEMVDKILRGVSPKVNCRTEIHSTRSVYPVIVGSEYKMVTEPQKVLGIGVYEYSGKGSVVAEYSYANIIPVLDKDNVPAGYCAGRLFFLNLDKKITEAIDEAIITIPQVKL